MKPHTYTVSEITQQIKAVLEGSFSSLWLTGEISNFKRHSSGHLYFTLKDENAQINCAMWRFKASQLRFAPQNGMKVNIEGKVQVYEKGGNYQFIVQQIQPAGIGDLQLAFEQLKEKLNAEGLFDSIHKKTLPQFPDTIGVISSPTGAALQDIISVLQRRFPSVQILLYPVRVQGDGAAQEIADALKFANKNPRADVLIVGRGGGSLEDLWAFNEEITARAIFDSKIPVISAVGHEVDFSIADFVADHRAPTPSAAAEIAVKDQQELRGIIQYFQEKIADGALGTIRENQQNVQQIIQSYGFRKPLDTIHQKMQRLDVLSQNIGSAVKHQFAIQQQLLANYQKEFSAANPQNILERGYSITRQKGKVITDATKLDKTEPVEIQFAKGKTTAEIKSTGENDE